MFIQLKIAKTKKFITRFMNFTRRYVKSLQVDTIKFIFKSSHIHNFESYSYFRVIFIFSSHIHIFRKLLLKAFRSVAQHRRENHTKATTEFTQSYLHKHTSLAGCLRSSSARASASADFLLFAFDLLSSYFSELNTVEKKKHKIFDGH